MGKIDSISIGNCGEYFVAAELERHGFTAAVPMSNTANFDVLAIDKYNPYALKSENYKSNWESLGKGCDCFE